MNGNTKATPMPLLEVANELERLADICENNYQNCNAFNRPAALLQSKDCVIRALGEVAHNITVMSVDVSKYLNEQTEVVASLDINIKLLDLKMKGHDELMARKHIGQFVVRKKAIVVNPAKLPGIVYPERVERPTRYTRQPLNYSRLDEIGHGVRVQEPAYPGTIRRVPQTPAAVAVVGPAASNIYAPGILSAGGSEGGSSGSNLVYDVSSVSSRSGATIAVRGGGEYAAGIYSGTLRQGQMMRPGAVMAQPPNTNAPVAMVMTNRGPPGTAMQQPPQAMPNVGVVAAQPAAYRSGSISGSSGLPTPAQPSETPSSMFPFQQGAVSASAGSMGPSRRSSSGAGSVHYAPGMSPYGMGPMMNLQQQVPVTPAGGHYASQQSRPSLSSGNEGGVILPPPNFPVNMDALPPPPPPPEDLPPPPPMPMTDMNAAGYRQEYAGGQAMAEVEYLPMADRMQRKGPRDPPWAPEEFIQKVRAVYEYVQDKNDELTFQEGSIIYVMKKNEDGWWEGVMENATGLFPGNYVEVIS